MTPFAESAPMLIRCGYVAHPIAPGTKSPGTYCSGGWNPQKGWTARQRVFPNVLAQWMIWPDAGVGVLTGRGLICIDIDQEEIVGPLLAILPTSNVQKKGRKGISLFYRGNTEVIRSKNYRTPEKVGLVDLLAEGRQTVLPPSIHPDTGEPYFWWTDDTLMDTRLEDLPELPDDIGEQISELLKQFGYDPDHERDHQEPMMAARSARQCEPDATSLSGLFRKVNDLALTNLHAWVPDLFLYKLRRKPGGYSAVATWRASCSGRPLAKRERNLSIIGSGIKDFGTGDTYSPVDLVMVARELDNLKALDWLLERLPQEPQIVLRK